MKVSASFELPEGFNLDFCGLFETIDIWLIFIMLLQAGEN